MSYISLLGNGLSDLQANGLSGERTWT